MDFLKHASIHVNVGFKAQTVSIILMSLKVNI